MDHQALDWHSSDTSAQQISPFSHHFNTVDHLESPWSGPSEDQEHYHSLSKRFVGIVVVVVVVVIVSFLMLRDRDKERGRERWEISL